MNNKNSNDVAVENKEMHSQKQKMPLSFYLTILTVAISIVLLILNVVKQDYQDASLKYVAIVFLCVYVVAFIGVVVYALVSKQQVKNELQTVKTVGEGFKLTMKVLNKVFVFLTCSLQLH